MSHNINIENQSFVGDPDKYKGARDDNALGFGWRPGWPNQTVSVKNCKIDANGVAEGLKLSYCHDVTVENCEIIGGYEDCVDIVRGGNIVFNNCRFIANNTKHHFTIKCKVNNVIIKNSTFVNDFRSIWDGAFVDLGNWGDYDIRKLPKTKNIQIINCKFENVSWWKRVTTRQIYAEKPIIKNTKGFNFKIPSLFVKIFWAFKRCQAKKKI